MLTSSPLLRKSPHAMPDKKLPLIGPSNLGTGGCFVESSTDITFVYDCGRSITFLDVLSLAKMRCSLRSTPPLCSFGCWKRDIPEPVAVVELVLWSILLIAPAVNKDLVEFCSRPDKLHHGHNLNHTSSAHIPASTSRPSLTYVAASSLESSSDFSCRVESSSDFSCRGIC